LKDKQAWALVILGLLRCELFIKKHNVPGCGLFLNRNNIREVSMYFGIV
jgi:hypothetical protein